MILGVQNLKPSSMLRKNISKPTVWNILWKSMIISPCAYTTYTSDFPAKSSLPSLKNQNHVMSISSTHQCSRVTSQKSSKIALKIIRTCPTRNKNFERRCTKGRRCHSPSQSPRMDPNNLGNFGPGPNFRWNPILGKKMDWWNALAYRYS